MSDARDTPLCACGRPSQDAICAGCMTQLEHNLASLPELLGELETTLARQARIGGGKRGKGHSEPLPIDLSAMDEADDTRRCLVTWVQTIIESDGLDRHPADDVTAMALWLLAHVGWARRSDEAEQFAAEIRDVRRAIERRIDRPEQRLYAGPCATGPCTAQLYARPARDRIVCDGHAQDGDELYARPARDRIVCDGHAQDGTKGCGAIHSMTERRQWLRATVEDHLAPLQVILDALPMLMGEGAAVDVGKGTIRQWRSRGRLPARGIDRHGVELYRGGDVIDLVLDQATRTGPRRKDLDRGRMSA